MKKKTLMQKNTQRWCFKNKKYYFLIAWNWRGKALFNSTETRLIFIESHRFFLSFQNSSFDETQQNSPDTDAIIKNFLFRGDKNTFGKTKKTRLKQTPAL
jgi:hypothetical protein